MAPKGKKGTRKIDPSKADQAPADETTSSCITFPIVGIGASAGGLAAFESFFSGMPADVEPGMAFVLIQHLAPDHKSILSDLIRRYTKMRVYDVEDGMVVKPNCVYIIPAGHDMAFQNDKLCLFAPAAPRGQRLPIDFFFRSLAQDQHERAICIVLSGTGSDGTQGLRVIKGEGGMAMVQDPGSTEYDGMPRNAIATGLVDYKLKPAEMPAQLMTYVSHAFGKADGFADTPLSETENTLNRIFIRLRALTGHDFSEYKATTVRRRIERRMAVHQISSIDDYAEYLKQTPAEAESLFCDLLIGVTCFFRDPEAFSALEGIIPELLSYKPAGSVIRVWSPGCSSGEEAYSLAILLQEYVETQNIDLKVQIFATDIDSRAIATARAGLYPVGIAADVTPARLSRFFTIEPGGVAYRINKDIRDMLVFSEQDMTKDPPFSKLDLISCRNLLIYMGGALQKKIISLFHYALNPGGILFLGSSETVGNSSSLFALINRKVKIYRRKENNYDTPAAYGRFLTPSPAQEGGIPRVERKATMQLKPTLRQLTERALLQIFIKAAALVNQRGDILYLHGRTGMFLEPAPGETGIANILEMAREGLRRELTIALRRADEDKETVRCSGLKVKTNGDYTTVNLIISPVGAGQDTARGMLLYLVVFEEVPVMTSPFTAEQAINPNLSTEEGERGLVSDIDFRIVTLEQELRAKEEYLQAVNEELETSNEELTSSNEEMQSVNEELQSTNEELETSKEELQSVNEELATINAELQTNVIDLTRANNDMNNLLSGTGIGTVFVDHEQRILRFTPTVTEIINLIPTDVGRPVGHILSNLTSYDTLVADIQSVMYSLIPREVDVQTTEGNWFTMRIQPYRTLENVIEGAVITFFDITESKKIREAFRKSQAMLNAALDTSQVGIIIAEAPSGILSYVNSAALSVRGGDREGIVDRTGLEQYVKSWQFRNLDGKLLQPDEEPLARAILFGEANSRELIVRTIDNEDRIILANAAPIKDDEDKLIAGITVFTDITERRRTEEALQKAFDEIRTLRGIVPICSNCKKIRDDKGFWKQVESYVSEHTEAKFSHGFCPECLKKLYPDFNCQFEKKI